jgi:hypothetical protein
MSAFPDNFFEALAREGGDAAMHTLRDAAFESGLEQDPSPRAQPFFNEGEWEFSKTLLPLTLVESSACFGLLTKVPSPRGVTYTRFCGKPQALCDIRSHQTSKLIAGMQTPGWYLAGGPGPRQGSLWEIRFPPFRQWRSFLEPSRLEIVGSGSPFSYVSWAVAVPPLRVDRPAR